jgi:peptide/nickel transport system ATP-binding protein
MTSTSALLSIDRLTLSLPPGSSRQRAVNDVSLELHAGEVLCLIGESGSGKSTLASAILGLLRPGMSIASGSIRFRGTELTTLAAEDYRALRGAHIGLVMQDPAAALNPLLTVGAQVEDVLAAHAISSDRRVIVERALETAGFERPAMLAARRPYQLSGGQRQRATLARSIALRPELLIADEPTTALDVTSQAKILALFRRLRDETGMALLLVTHDIGIVSDVADRVAVMRKGKIVEHGPAATVLRSPSHPYTQTLIDAVPRPKAITDDVRADAPVLLKVAGLRKRLGAHKLWRTETTMALDGVSLELRRGDRFGIVGESGSGKTTLARCILGLLPPDAGSIHFADHDLAGLPRRAFRSLRSRIQMVLQDPGQSLNPLQPVGEAIVQGPISLGVSRQVAHARAQKLLDELGLPYGAASRLPHEFSGGEKQRICIARALVHEPEVLVADEPVSSLDVTVQAQILDIFERLGAERRLSMIFITHDLRVAARLCNRIAVMRRGRIIETGLAADLFARPADAYTRALLAATPGRQFFEAAHESKANVPAITLDG